MSSKHLELPIAGALGVRGLQGLELSSEGQGLARCSMP